MRDLGQIVKAYDVRGIYPDQLDETVAEAVGAAFVQVVGAAGERIVVGHDMRPSSEPLVAAFTRGAISQGADVVQIGLVSTDALYFASGSLDAPGAMFTASHNPAQYNGIKMCHAYAQPIGMETGLAEIRDLVEDPRPVVGPTGTITEHDVLEAYAAHLLSLAPVEGRRLKVVADAGSGMAGHTAPAVFARLADQVDLVPMYFELDGSFPNHEANPIEPTNLADLQHRVVA